MIDEISFGEWLRKQRRALDLTRQALAAQAGCAEITLRRIENGTLKPSKELALILLEKLGIPEFERPQWMLFARGLAGFPTSPSGTVTFLFTDIEGSTKLAREHPEIWEALRARHHAILQKGIESNKGYIFQIIGDAFCAAFHTAEDAVHAAVESQKNLQAENWGDAPLKVRMGINTGKAEIQKNGEYHGYLAMSRVQRLISAAHGGQTLLSATTEQLTHDILSKDITLRDLGERRLKDMPQPEHIFQLIIPSLPADYPPLRTLEASPNNLLAQLTSFIGREKEQAEVIKHIRKYRLVTLTGPGGVGKTRLSIKVGEQVLGDYANGVWLVELASLNDSALLPQTVMALFGIAVAQPNTSQTEILINFLRAKTSLLILDNCEHILQACAQLADTLLKNCPNLKILATSRESLGITGEAAYPVPSLRLPDLEQLLENFREYESVRLFEERAQLAKADFALTIENASSVAQICHRLDGIPLAIELAAAHVNMFSTEQIAARLNESFNLLTGGSRTALPRQQTIRASIEWGWNLLANSERILLRRLSVFAGGWILESANSVCSGDDIESHQILEVMTHLVAKSLVVANQESGHETRYHLLETIRQYAHEKLEESEKENRTRDTHLDYFLNLAETAAPNLHKPEQLEWLARLEVEQSNLRAALEWSLNNKELPEASLRLSAALGTFWVIKCNWVEGSKWLQSALSKSSSVISMSEKAARARALYQDAELADGLDDVERFKNSANLSFALAQEGIDKRDIAIARFYVGQVFQRSEDNEKARALFEQSLAEFRGLKDLYWEANTYRQLSHILVRKGELSRKEKNSQDLELARKAGERLLLAAILISHAIWAWNGHQFDKAEAYLKESEMLNDQIGYKGGMGFFFQAVMAHFNNDYQLARIMYEKVREQYDIIGEKGTKSLAIVNLGILARDEGNFQQAESYIREALEIAEEIGTGPIIGYRLALLGEIEFLQGNIKGAKQNFREGLLIARELVGERYTVTGTLVIFSNSFVNLQPQNAVRVISAAHTYLQKFDEPLELFFLRDSDRAVAQARQQLDESTFNAVWAEGRKMTIEEAYDLALKMVEEM